MRILWHSVAPWAASGYGQQTKVNTPRIRELGHDLALSAYWGLAGSVLGWEGMDVYPADDRWGNRLLPTYATMHQADLVITLMDVWVLNAKNLGELPLASWVPIDHEPAPPKVLEFFAESGSRPIAMSRFGERMLRDGGLDPLYVPHSIDTGVFRPRRDLRAETRRKMGVPEDAFVVGMVAANKGRAPARKAFPETMAAFARLREDRPDAHLYLHTEPTGFEQGVPMGRLIQQCGVPQESVHFTDALSVEIGLDPEHMAALYSAFDVLANPAYGEGFGIPILEAQSCGCPVIVTDCSSMTELCGAGWLVHGEPWYNTPQGSFYAVPQVTGERSIHQAMLEAYEARGDAALRGEAREFALQYDADRVTEQFWKPALARLAQRPVDLRTAA